MRTFLIILFILILLIASAYFYIKSVLNKVAFKIETPNFNNLSFIQGSAILVGVKFPLNVNIANGSKLDITVQNLYISLFYKGVLIGKSIQTENVKITANKINKFILNFYIENNDNTKELIKEYIKKSNPELEIKTKFYLYNSKVINFRTSDKIIL